MEAKNKITKYSLIIWTFFTIILFFASAQAATHYVSPTGSATWGNSTNINTPCSLATANSNAAAGDLVYFRAGTYTTSLNPSNSGSPGNEITFAAYNGEKVYLENNSYAIDLRGGEDYIIFNGFKSKRKKNWILWADSSDYIELKNCDFGLNSSAWSTINISGYCNYWRIHDNIFYNEAGTYQNNGNIVRISSLSDGNEAGAPKYMYIFNNTFIDGGNHDMLTLEYVQYSVVFNNIFYSTGLMAGDCGQITPREHLVFNYNCKYNVIENNTFYESGATLGDNCTTAMHSMSGSANIVRKNKVYNFDRMIIDFYTSKRSFDEASNNTIYNNSAYNVFGDTGTWEGAITLVQYATGKYVRDNYIVNNIISITNEFGFTTSNVISNSTINNKWYGNHLYSIGDHDVRRLGSAMSITSAESLHPEEFHQNISSAQVTPPDSIDPLFTDPENGDLTLQPESPCVDSAVALTHTNGSGSSSIHMIVDNPYFFSAGLGITGWSNDYIYVVGSGNPANFIVKITGINHSTKTLTLARPQNWEDESEVHLAISSNTGWHGDGPDTGAEEYLSENLTISPPQGLIISKAGQ